MSSQRRLLLLFLLCCGPACQPQIGAGFPQALYAPLDLNRSIPISIVDQTEGASISGPNDAELVAWAMQDWSRALDGRLRFHVVAAEDDALVRVRFVQPHAGPTGDGQYGEVFAVSVAGQRGAVVFVRPDTEALGKVIARRAARDPLFRETVVYLTCLHELGHALGLAHTKKYADIMYSMTYGGDIEEYFMRYRRNLRQRGDIAEESGLSRSDRAHVRALYASVSGPT